ncbi:MAG: nitronate monooxygenase [Myxococcota bacterium]|nr:nitronate monooxygenase [Myxococcota bacterium]
MGSVISLSIVTGRRLVESNTLHKIRKCFPFAYGIWIESVTEITCATLEKQMRFQTKLTDLLKIDIPIMLAGMAGVAGPELVAAVSNAGGIGTLGAIGMSPDTLRDCIQKTRALLLPGKPMGVDLLLPKVGKGARATNKDYTGGKLEALIQVMIDEKIELFVCAVGVPPRWVVDRLHAHGIVVMNMVGSPKHIKYCIAAGVDIVCAQGTEAGGHTGAISTLVLLPQVVDLCKEAGILVVGAGGLYDGRGIAACFALGAEGVWMGSRFIPTHEANTYPAYKQAILKARSDDTIQTEIVTGRPARALKNAYIAEWETTRVQEKHELLQRGVVPFLKDLKDNRFGKHVVHPIPSGYTDVRTSTDTSFDPNISMVAVGQVCGVLNEIQSAESVVAELLASVEETFANLGARFPQFLHRHDP